MCEVREQCERRPVAVTIGSAPEPLMDRTAAKATIRQRTINLRPGRLQTSRYIGISGAAQSIDGAIPLRLHRLKTTPES